MQSRQSFCHADLQISVILPRQPLCHIDLRQPLCHVDLRQSFCYVDLSVICYVDLHEVQ